MLVFPMENKYCMTHFISCFMIIDTFPDEENVKENSRKVFLYFFPPCQNKEDKNRWKIIVILKIHLEYVAALIMHNLFYILFIF